MRLGRFDMLCRSIPFATLAPKDSSVHCRPELATCKTDITGFKHTMTDTTESESPDKKRNHLKDIALFFASPFIGLVYAVLLPGKVFQIAMREFKTKSKGQ